MGRRFSKASALLEKARNDFAMAESYLKSRDYAAASAAYLSVIREVLNALSRSRKGGTEVAEEIENEMLIPENVADAAEGTGAAYYDSRQAFSSVDKEPSIDSTIEKRDAAKRLIDYVFAYMQRG
ncbi:MAG: hypothetical protein M1603_02325 [Candidatus Marsarchaeota archaeon]|jgi:plasmid stabilization system protein ParE|nr:hypothetical protein [Candidatus Marsarchaeota archaeon]